jgi:hypothetical protein
MVLASYQSAFKACLSSTVILRSCSIELKNRLCRERNTPFGKRSPFECRNRLGVHEVVRRNDRNNFGPTGRELMRLSDNQVGDRLHAALEAVGTEEGETIRGNTALVAAPDAEPS